MEQIIRRKKLLHLVGLSDSTIYRKELAGEFPRRVKLSSHSVGWRQSEVEEWLENRPRAEPSELDGEH